MSDVTCPNCGAEYNLIRQRSKRQPQRQNLFHSTQHIPTGILSGLYWLARGGRVEPDSPQPKPQQVTVKVETWDYANNRIQFQDLDSRITWPAVCELAEMIQAGIAWTRDNIVSRTSINESRVRIYQGEFKRLGYLTVTADNRSVLTSAGKRFLRGCLAMKNGTVHNPQRPTTEV